MTGQQGTHIALAEPGCALQLTTILGLTGKWGRSLEITDLPGTAADASTPHTSKSLLPLVPPRGHQRGTTVPREMLTAPSWGLCHIQLISSCDIQVSSLSIPSPAQPGPQQPPAQPCSHIVLPQMGPGSRLLGSKQEHFL